MLIRYMILDRWSKTLSLYRLVDIRRGFPVDFCRLVSLTVTGLTTVFFGFDLLFVSLGIRDLAVRFIYKYYRTFNRQPGLVGRISIERGQSSHGNENISILTTGFRTKSVRLLWCLISIYLPCM